MLMKEGQYPPIPLAEIHPMTSQHSTSQHPIEELDGHQLEQVSGGLVALKRPLGACPACTSGLNKFLIKNQILNPVIKVAIAP
ncbi:MAG: hypothetical protein ACKOPN_08475 [Prochlorococcaceae cyanobacterium]